FARGPDSRNFLQASLADVLLAPGAMRANGETMRLVAQSLDEIEQGVARWQLERIFSRHEKGFPSGIAIRTLGNSDQRHVSDAHGGERRLCRAELTLTAVDQHQIGPRLLVVRITLRARRDRLHGRPRR